METVITKKLYALLRCSESDLLSDGGKLQLIGSRCGRVPLAHIHLHVGVVRALQMSGTSFTHILQADQMTTIPRRFIIIICCSCDALSHGSAWKKFFEFSTDIWTRNTKFWTTRPKKDELFNGVKQIFIQNGSGAVTLSGIVLTQEIEVNPADLKSLVFIVSTIVTGST